MLVEQRNLWRDEFIRHKLLDNSWLNTYISNRESNLWRCSKHMEEMCEYILFLESELGVIR